MPEITTRNDQRDNLVLTVNNGDYVPHWINADGNMSMTVRIRRGFHKEQMEIDSREWYHGKGNKLVEKRTMISVSEHAARELYEMLHQRLESTRETQ